MPASAKSSKSFEILSIARAKLSALSNIVSGLEMPMYWSGSRQLEVDFRGRHVSLRCPNARLSAGLFEFFLNKGSLEKRSQFFQNFEPFRAYIDVGGNLGYYGVLNLLTGNFEKAFLFEPGSFNFKYLVANMANFPFAKCFNMGLSDKAGSANLAMPLKLYGNWYRKLNNTGIMSLHGDGTFRKEKVRLEVFDEVFAEEKFAVKDCFIKIDVEGHELFVLNGMKQAIKAGNTFQVEVNSNINPQLNGKIFELFQANSYKALIASEGGGLEEIRQLTDLSGQGHVQDVVFRR